MIFQKIFNTFLLYEVRSLIALIRFTTNHVIYDSDILKSSDKICWKCGTLLDSIYFYLFPNYIDKSFCPCKKKIILDPNLNVNLFEVFDTPIQFHQNINRLTRRRNRLQVIFRPEKTNFRTVEEIDFAIIQSFIVDKSYNTLSDPFRRAVYLLQLEGIDFVSSTPTLDADFLIEMFEVNEIIDEVLSNERLLSIKIEYQKKMKEYYCGLTRIFNDKQYTIARAILAKIQFFNYITHRVKTML